MSGRDLIASVRGLPEGVSFEPAERGQISTGVDTVAGEFGVVCLVLGFALQLVGYSLEIGGTSPKAGSARLLVALAMATVALVLAIAAWRVFRPKRAASLSAAIEWQGSEASREIREEKEDADE